MIDKSGRVQRFSPNGLFELEWDLPDSEKGFPSGMDVGPDGRVYIADTHYHRILVFDRDGNEISRFGSPGTGPGQFMLLTDVAAAPDGSIYVSEFGGNDRVSKFSANAVFVFAFGDLSSGDGSLQRPSGLAVDNQGHVWVADAGNHRVCHFAPDGKFVGSFGHMGRRLGEFRYPRDLAFADDQTLLVADGENDRVQHFSQAGEVIRMFGWAGRGQGEFYKPLGVAVLRNRAYVADSENDRVSMWRIEPGLAVRAAPSIATKDTVPNRDCVAGGALAG